MSSRTRAWSDIPPEILSSIVKRLQSRIDVFRVHFVCTKWRSSLNPNPNLLSPFLPRKISNTSLPFTDSFHGPLLLVTCTVLLVHPLRSSGSSSGWILTVEESNTDKLRILYPLSRNPVVNLPSNFLKYLDLLDFDVSEIDRSYILKFANDGKDVSGVVKVVVCSDRTIMVLCGEGTLVGIRLKNGKWGFVRHILLCGFTDMLPSREWFILLVMEEMCMPSHMTMNVIKTIAVDRLYGPECHQKLLIEPSGEFCLVVWYPCKYPGERVVFAVYRLDQVRREWTSITRLDDKIFFVSMDSCFFIVYIWDRCFLGAGYVAYSECCLDLFGACPIASHKLFQGASVNLHVNVLFFKDENHDLNYWRVSLSSIADLLWPTWFWPDMCPYSG